MKKIRWFMLSLMNIGLLFTFQGCGNKKEAAEGGVEFEYFPARNIYFNVQSSKFFYSLDGAKTWDSVKAASKKDITTLGRKQKLFSKSAEVWKDNEAHLKRYEGSLISILKEGDRNSVDVRDDVTEKRKIVRNTGTVRKEAPKRKGIKGFFDKVFKKKDRK